MVFLFLPSTFNRTVIPIQELPVHSFYTYYSDNRWIQPLAGQCSFYFRTSFQLFVHRTSAFWLDQKEIICILPLYLHDHAHGNAYNVSVYQHKKNHFSSEFRIDQYEFCYNSCRCINFMYSYAYCRKYYVEKAVWPVRCFCSFLQHCSYYTDFLSILLVLYFFITFVQQSVQNFWLFSDHLWFDHPCNSCIYHGTA